MKSEILIEARHQVGLYLRKLRKEKGISAAALHRQTGMSLTQIQDIEQGRRSYGIDNFLKYISAIDCYFFLADKEGHHLDFNHMASKADPDKAAL
jgi:transcriptional regulator with XRE-family HTH domain